MARSWSWETESSDWGVTLDLEEGLLRWWGADKPRGNTPAYALGGGGVDQPVVELLHTATGSYSPPAALLAEILEAARALAPTSTTLDCPRTPRPEEAVAWWRAMSRAVTGQDLPDGVLTRRLQETIHDDDRPNQTPEVETEDQYTLGGVLALLYVAHLGTWSGVWLTWSTADFHNVGPVTLRFEPGRCTLTAMPGPHRVKLLDVVRTSLAALAPR